MTVSITSVTAEGEGAFRVVWSSTLSTPTFYVFVDGKEVTRTTLTSRVFHVEAGATPVLEVLDDPDETPSLARTSRRQMQWQGSGATARYRIERYNGADWDEVGSVEDIGVGGLFDFNTDPLPDGTAASYRVVPIGTNDNEGTPAALTINQVRHPDPPDVGYAYAAGTQKVTITES